MTHVVIPIDDSSQVFEVRRAAAALAREVGMDETAAGQLAILVTEAATNVLKHGGGGRLLLAVSTRGRNAGVEMLALDKGSGMEDIRRCFEDGYSTAGSPGSGLGAIRRMAASYDIYSAPNQGVVLMVWVAARPVKQVTANADEPGFEVSGLCTALQHEQVSGDAWISQPRVDGVRVLVADGLGHGIGAAEAASTAIDVARRHPGASVTDLLERIHQALRPTRGAAVAVAEVDLRDRTVRFAGIGNIAGSIVGPGFRRQMVSHNGTAGHQARHIDAFTYPWDAQSLLILHSDGIATHWSLDKYPGLVRHDPSVIAGVLFRDFARGRDDASVVVARQSVPPEVPR
jgi:anti-sigma regulatory factor (Ser/Thr protein kinase)